MTALDVDQAAPLQFSITAQSPHVFAYRFWYQAPGTTEWVKVAEGHTADSTPDNFSFGPVPAGTSVAYWLSASGHPNTAYRALVTLSQNGQPVPGGGITHQGTTSASGGAVEQHQVALA